VVVVVVVDGDDEEEVVGDVLLVVGCGCCERRISNAPAAMNAIRIRSGNMSLFLFLTFLLVSFKLG